MGLEVPEWNLWRAGLGGRVRVWGCQTGGCPGQVLSGLHIAKASWHSCASLSPALCWPCWCLLARWTVSLPGWVPSHCDLSCPVLSQSWSAPSAHGAAVLLECVLHSVPRLAMSVIPHAPVGLG